MSQETESQRTFTVGDATIHLKVGYKIATKAWTPTLLIVVKKKDDNTWDLYWNLFDCRTLIAEVQLKTFPQLPYGVDDELMEAIGGKLSASGFPYKHRDGYIYKHSLDSIEEIATVAQKVLDKLSELQRYISDVGLLGKWKGKLWITVKIAPTVVALDPDMTTTVSSNIFQLMKAAGLIKGQGEGVEEVNFTSVDEFYKKWIFFTVFLPENVDKNFFDRLEWGLRDLKALQRMGINVAVRLSVVYGGR